ncbi:MAG: DUF4325 domain-containing protein [Haemophilus parahaemolyticus]|uniref:DUF4325 domain-containing protein n=1 Tax=Haemophilus parahaemolyticus TaxID=735 RepID=A0A377I2J0_HAEPH|nr:DUF4325 domain-containing protein [Haemophilus parahaemolyticus]MBS6009925.1 DUF4325 domain-containing protein [Haemophilus parahaemolyticus]STO64571.1 Uncharacterised protein [Haemophilus parahaemolyticus]
MNTKYINVAKDFSPKAFGRTEEHGPFNGTKFRKEFLEPIWKDYDRIEVDFSDFDASPGSTFLSGAFLMLVTKDNYSYDEVKNKLVILPKDSVFPSSVDLLLERVKPNA